jgi:manganese/zinc/iron transport system permease protein
VTGVGMLLANLFFIALCYKELKLATFDAGLAATLGFMPGVIHYALMTMVSITAVGAFDAVGSILVIALMIAPPATAYLLTDRLSRMIGLSALIGAGAAISGYWVARWLDVSIAGSMASMAGVLFALAWMLAPERGLIAAARRRERQRWWFAQQMLTLHLLHHEGTTEAATESRVDHLSDHLRWSANFAQQVVARATERGLVQPAGEVLVLTESGRRLAREASVQT